ncbi:hypothetical protein Q8G35_17295 [Peribacillus simplex]|uniref:Uncharacterized protein n=2 Tax=Peribacillus TaxID=2675229 RepID=A0AA90P715_9BACI|nr:MULTISPECIES: hypothetical protein [Peribacillus]MDP1420101.1 hypothetical protein [Peribacillus simplex]MDP1454734.1 hypothetical protein [Peribacillus frigoritolerans]
MIFINRKTTKRIIIVCGLLLLLIGLSSNTSFGKKSIAVASIILTDNEIKKFEERNDEILYLSTANNTHPLFSLLKKKGWSFKEQMGSGYIFNKDDSLITVESESFTKEYTVWHLPINISTRSK